MVKYFFLGLFTFMLSVCVCLAQPDANGDPDAVPLGGLEILLLAGGALGIKKLISGKNKK